VFRAQNPHFSPTRFHEDPKFSYTLLRDLVINHLLLYDVGVETRWQLGKLLLIEVGEVKSTGVKFLK